MTLSRHAVDLWRGLLALTVFLILASAPGAASAQPSVDGALDALYLQRGYSVDYVTNIPGITATLHQVDDPSIDPAFVYLVWEIGLGFVDNSYGNNQHSTWVQGHSFGSLLESDGQRLQLINVCGEDVVDIFMDIIDDGAEHAGEPSGHGANSDPATSESIRFLIDGGDWTDFTYDTSLAYDLNDLGFCSGGSCSASPPGDGTDLLVDSPPFADEPNYVPASPYGEWEFRHLYEMRIDRTVFSTALCPIGTPASVGADPVQLHASPSKAADKKLTLFRATSTLGDYVWLDADRDGVQDAGEAGLANVTLDLYSDDGDGVFEPAFSVDDGRLDLNHDGLVDASDDGTAEGVAVVDGAFDLDGDGVIETNGDDDGTVNGITVDDGELDLDGDGAAGETNGDDDGLLAPVLQVDDGRIDLNRDGVVDASDDGMSEGVSVVDGAFDLDGDGMIETNGDDDGEVGGIPVDDGELDFDLDGTAGETNGDDDGLLGVSDGRPIRTATTDSDGGYIFTRLGSGTYFVDVTDENRILTGFSLTTGPQTETDPSSAAALPLQEENLAVDFGFAPTDVTSAVVGDYVWSDDNQNGIQDLGEAGISGVELRLVSAGADGLFGTADDMLEDTTDTDPDGSYLFTGVAPGEYQVVADADGALAAAGYSLTTGPQSDTNPGTPFSVAAGGVFLNADYGFFRAALGTVGNLVWFDVNEDHDFDAGEPGFGNVTVALINDADGDGVWESAGADGTPGNADDELIIASTVTGSDGSYGFSGLPLDDGDGDADYLVIVTDTRHVLGRFLPSILLPLSTADGTGKFEPYAVDLDGAPTDLTADFGFQLDNPEALLGDRVWYDQNADGVQDFSEPGIEGVTLLLYNDFNKNGAIDPSKDEIIAERDSDINGNYFFPRLDFDNNGEGYIAVIAATNFRVLDGRLDLNADGAVDGADDGAVNGVTVIDGELDVDANGMITPADDGLFGGAAVIDGVLDLDLDGSAGETNGEDAAAGALATYSQTGDPDEAGTCGVCDGQSATEFDNGFTVDLTHDYGYDSIGTFQVGDTVYRDDDADGTQDVGEPGIQFVVMGLYDDLDGDGVIDVDEPLIATDTTDASGSYLFESLVAGDYVVAVLDDFGLLVGYTQTEGGSPCCAPTEAVTLGPSTLDVDFGFVRSLPASISNFVWEDSNGDGVQDTGEPGVKGVTVRLYTDADNDGVPEPNGDDGAAVATTVTDTGGLYTFTVTAAGRYFVEVVPPSGYAITLQNQGPTTSDSDPSPATGVAAVTQLTQGESDPTWDAGLYRPVTVGDRVWLDVDGDGVQDVGEPGIANVTVVLEDALGNPIGSAVTDSDGNYVFAREAPATYAVDLDESTLPAGLAISGGTDPSSSSTLLSGQVVLTKDFGYTDAGGAILGDTLWSDADNDGVQDPGEPGIGGVTVELIGAGADGQLGTPDDTSATTTTAPDGSYHFTGLAASDYRVNVTDTGGVLAGYTLTSGPQSSSDPTAPITVAAGDVYLDADFGYFQAGLGAIGTHVWLDGDDDGFRDAGEAGIASVSLALAIDADADGAWDPDGADDTPGNADDEPIIATVLTASDGSYLFAGLALDDGDGDFDYLVVVTDTGDALDGLTLNAGTPNTDDQSQASPYAVALSAAPGDVDPTADFGYNRPGTIGDRIWSDADGDGIQDPGEAGIGGVTVELRDAVSGALIATETTAADGSYLFPLLVAGDYRVVVTGTGGVLAGYTQTGDPDSTCPGGGCDGESTTTLGVGGSDLARDFGYRDAALFSIAGTVFEDSDRDAVHDAPPEAGFEGVTVELWHDVDGNGVLDPAIDERVASTVTDGAGDYSFPGLPDDDYVVAVTDTAGVLTGYELTSGLDQIPVELMGADVSDVDFGYVRDPLAGSIGDTVWLDVDPPGPESPDGLRGPNEAGLSRVTLWLYRDLDGDGVAEPGGDDGASIATTVTDAEGNYRFSGLAAGDYFIDVDGTTLPTSLATTVGTTDPSSVIALSEGERYDDADFGYVPSAGTAIVGDFVWYDADSDGLQDPGELGIAGIDVTVDGGGLASPVTVTTGADGYWLVTGLPADAAPYFAFFDSGDVAALGYATTPTNTGADATYQVTLAAGDVITHLDWGFDGGSVGSIGDFVWLDLNGDAVQDAGEMGIPGVTLDLVDDATGDVLATTTTGAAGDYLFSGLPLGVGYRVAVTDLGGILDGLQRSSAAPGTLTPTAGTPDIDTADFGYVPGVGAGSLGTHVWHDSNGDGVRQPGESAFEGVTLDVWHDVDGSVTLTPGDNRLRSAATDSNGVYELKGLPLGNYLVDLTDASGVLAGFTKTSGTAGADDNSQADPYALTLTSVNPDNLTADFGFEDAVGALTISGTVFEDADVDAALDFVDGDGDGVYDPAISPAGPETTTEVPVAGAAMTLFRVVGGERFLIGQAKTDAAGFYAFSNLPAGDYEVAVDTTGTAVDGFLQTTQTTTGGAQPSTLADTGDADWTQPNTADSRNTNFGFFDGGVTATPVTLAYFETARRDSERVEIEWGTATEVGSVGFYLWAWDGESWQRLNDSLLPAAEADSIEFQHYRFEGALLGETYLLEEVDVFAVSRYHGPFELGRAYGRRQLEIEPIDWRAIGLEHKAKQARRRLLAERSSRLEKGRGGGSAHLLIDSDGVYRVSYEQLAAAGLDLAGIAAGRIAVSNRGESVPVRVEPAGRFGPGSFIELLASGLDTLYTQTNVYVVRVDPANAARVKVDGSKPQPRGVPAASYRETLHVERERFYSFGSPNGDPWYDTGILSFGAPASASFGFETDGRLAGPVSLTVSLWGVTDWAQSPDHHVVFEVNGVELAEAVFDGLADHPVSFDVPESVLLAGENTLRVALPGDLGVAFDLVNVDHYRLTYPRHFSARGGELTFEAAGDVFEVDELPSPDVVVYRSTPDRLELVTGAKVSRAGSSYRVHFPGSREAATYRVASGAGIRSAAVEPGRAAADLTSGSAELLIISHPDFLAGLDPLIGARRAGGWTVKAVDVEDVYAQFGFSIFDPQAIHDYVAFAQERLGTEAVLLVGGDTYDYHDNLGLGGISFIPSIYGRTGDFVRFAPADGLYTDLDGDEVPDLAIGRLPVRTAAELEMVLGKTLDYPAQAARRLLILAADDEDLPSHFDFSQASEQLAARTPADWRVERIYLDVLGASTARTRLLEAMSEGASVTSFMGHSGPVRWSFDGLFSAADAAALDNAGRPTVVAQWGCWTTYYVSPFANTLAHELLLAGDRGAAAVLGATTLTEARSERALALEVFGRLFEPGQTLGGAILEAKRRLAEAEDPALLDVLIGWNLLGDPTLTVSGRGQRGKERQR